MTSDMSRQRTDRIFDHSGRIPLPRRRDRFAEDWSLLRDLSRLSGRLPVSSGLPRGDGHPVLVIPGLLSADFLVRGVIRLLTDLGYDAAGWGAGVNLGPTPSAWRTVETRLLAAAERCGRAVSLIGHSLGGIIARALAFEHPDRVRQVITVCSPVRLPTASRLGGFYYRLLRRRIDEDILLSRIVEPPPVPTTAIYSPCDGIVAWQSCFDHPAPGRENVAIEGPHSTMLSNPAAIRIVADRLARPEQRSELAERSG